MSSKAIRGPRWQPFVGGGLDRVLPPERRKVLVAFSGDRPIGTAPSVVVGYLRFSAGDRACPFFVTPGFDRGRQDVTHFADCLGDDFTAPHWHPPTVDQQSATRPKRRGRK